MAVTVQGYLALDLVKKNNIELGEGRRSRLDHTVAALRTCGHGGAGADQPAARARPDHRRSTPPRELIDRTGEL
jgi:hypothetical protein